MKTFILRHEHKYGETNYPLQSKEDITESAMFDSEPSETLQKIIKALDIEFEPEKYEQIHIEEVEKGCLNVDEL